MAILKDRMLKAGPIWRRLVKRAFGADNKGLILQQAVSGGAAGNIAVTKIKANDHIVGVIQVTTTTAALVDLTDEFSVAADGVINNTGGTSSATHDLIVTWEAFDD